MQISVKSDVDKALKNMSRLHKKQIPFAAALGLTMTAKKVAKVEQLMMVRCGQQFKRWLLGKPVPKYLGGK